MVQYQTLFLSRKTAHSATNGRLTGHTINVIYRFRKAFFDRIVAVIMPFCLFQDLWTTSSCFREEPGIGMDKISIHGL